MKAKTNMSFDDKPVALLAMEINTIGVWRQVESDLVEADADKRRIRVKKCILECPELDAIERHVGHIRKIAYRYAIPGFPLRGGYYVVSLTAVPKIVEQLDELIGGNPDCCDGMSFHVLVDQFLAVYEERVKDDRNRLRALFDEADYPPVGALRQQFHVDYSFQEFAVSGGLRDVDLDLYHREVERAKERWAKAIEDAKQAMRAQVVEILDLALERLRNERPRINGAVRRLTDWISLFEDWNLVTKDEELKQIINQVRAWLSPQVAEAIKGNESYRDVVQGKIQQIKGMLGSTARVILFEDA